MKKSKLITLIIAMIATVTSTFALASCGLTPMPSSNSELTLDSNAIYALIQELGYTGSFEEFIASLKGEKGDPGEGFYGAEINENNELVLTYLDGTTLNLGVVKGQDGTNGTNGVDGKSAYEIYCSYHPEYEGTEEEWMKAIVAGTLTFNVNVTFNTNGGSEVAESKLVYNTNLLEALSAYVTEKEHYNFVGWTYADGSAIGENDKVPAEGVSVKAEFIGEEVVVIICQNGKTYGSTRHVVHYGDNLIEALNEARPFPGSKVEWQYVDGTPVGAEETVKYSQASQYFNAIVEKETYTLTFADGGVAYDGAQVVNSKDESVVWYLNGEPTTLSSIALTGEYGTNVTTDENGANTVPTAEVYEGTTLTSHRYGYTFAGWYYADGTEWDGTIPAADATVYAKWNQNGTLVVMYDADKTTVVKAYIYEKLPTLLTEEEKALGVIDYTAPEGLALEGWKFMGREYFENGEYVKAQSNVYMEDQFGTYTSGQPYYGFISYTSNNSTYLTSSGVPFFFIGNSTVLGPDGVLTNSVYKFYASLWDAKYSKLYYTLNTAGCFEVSGQYTYKPGTQTVSVKTTESEVYIPSSCQGLPVVIQKGNQPTTSAQGFEDLSTIKKVVIGKGVKEIGTYAFGNCIALEEVVFEEGTEMQIIGHMAFAGCSALKGFDLPASVKVLGAYVFEGAFASNVDLSFDLSNVEILYGALFYKANGNSVTVTGLKNIPNAVKTYTNFATGSDATDYGTLVTSYGENIITYFNNKWGNPDAGSTYYFFIDGASSVSTTSIRGFFGYSNFNSIIISEGTETVGTYAFMGCTAEGLKLTMPESVTTLGYGICKNSTVTEFESSATAIPDQAFSGCEALVSYSGSNYVSIGDDAFNGCIALQTVRIPEKLASVADTAFSGCTGIESVVCSSANTHYSYDRDTKFLISLDTKSIVIHADKTAKEIVLPEGIESLGGFYSGNTNIEKVVLPKSLVKVDAEAFKDCSALKEVVFPVYADGETPTLTEIGNHAFYQTALTSVTVPAYVQVIGEYAFAYTKSMTEFVIEKDSELSVVPSYLLAYSTVKNVYFNGKEEQGQSKIVLVEDYAFSNAKSLETISWGATPATNEDGTYVYKMEFQGNVFASVTTGFVLTLPSNLDKIHYNAFSGLTGVDYNSAEMQIKELPAGFTGSSITEFVIPKSVEIIGYEDSITNISGQKGGNKVTTLTVEEGSNLKTLGLYAFNCVMAEGAGTIIDLTNATQLTKVYKNAFYSCKMETLKLPGNITMWGSSEDKVKEPSTMTTTPSACYPFGAASKIKTLEIAAKTIEGLGTADQDGLIYGQKYLTTVKLPEGTTRIGRGSFMGCVALKDINIPSTVTEIADYAFYCGTSSNANKVLTSIELPAGLESIGYAAFTRVYLTSVTIPAKVAEISDYAFYQNTSLTNVNFTEDSQLTTVGASAFMGCTAFETINLPAKVTTVGANAFNGCSKLTVTPDPASKITTVGQDAFMGIKELKISPDEEGFVSIGSTIYSYAGTASEIVIPAQYTIIEKAAFKNNSSITSLTFEGDEVAIYDQAFFGCSNLASVTLPDNTTLGVSAFAECSKLNSIAIPDSVTTIPVAAFAKTGITEVTFGEVSKLETIDEYAFYACENLKAFTLPASVKNVNGAAFAQTGLTSVNWTSALEFIGDGAFAGLTLDSVTINSTTDQTLQIGTSTSKREKITDVNTYLEKGYTAGKTSSNVVGVFTFAKLGAVTFNAPNATKFMFKGGYIFAYAESVSEEKQFTVTMNVAETCLLDLNGGYSFYYSKVTAVNFPAKAVFSAKLGTAAFEGATALKEIYIPAYYSDLSSVNFKYSTALEKVVIGDGTEALNSSSTWTSGIFYNCTALKEIIINQPADSALVKIGSTVTATSSNCFGNIYGNVTVYVNSALLANYQGQTNWAKHITAGLKMQAIQTAE